jgi:hypothetical protein
VISQDSKNVMTKPGLRPTAQRPTMAANKEYTKTNSMKFTSSAPVKHAWINQLAHLVSQAITMAADRLLLLLLVFLGFFGNRGTAGGGLAGSFKLMLVVLTGFFSRKAQERAAFRKMAGKHLAYG